MRQMLIILLSLLGSNAFGQNWQMFPPDSLRYYINPLQDSVYIQGIDYRQYKKYSDTTEIDLGWFARLDSTSPGRFIQTKTANSNFGRKVLETPEMTTIIFVESYDGSIKLGVLEFSKSRKQGFFWNVYENLNIKITGEIASTDIYNGEDSLCSILLQVTRKTDNYTRMFTMEYSKQRGLRRSLVLYDIISSYSKLLKVPEVLFHTYKEMSVEEFFAPEIGSEFHYLEGNSSSHSGFAKWVCTDVQNNIGQFLLTWEGVKYKSVQRLGAPVFDIKEVPFRLNNYDTIMRLFNPEQYEYATKDSIINPIPSKFGSEKSHLINGGVVPRYSVVCGRLWLQRYSDIMHFYFNNDTTLYKPAGNFENWTNIFAQGFGLVDKLY